MIADLDMRKCDAFRFSVRKKYNNSTAAPEN